MRWRRVDVQRVIPKRFGVDYHESHVGTLEAAQLITHQPRLGHPGQMADTMVALKNFTATMSARLADPRPVAPIEIWFQMLGRRTLGKLKQSDSFAAEHFSCRRITPLVLSSISPLNSAHRPGLPRVGSQ
jgi:hypothetical protein